MSFTCTAGDVQLWPFLLAGISCFSLTVAERLVWKFRIVWKVIQRYFLNNKTSPWVLWGWSFSQRWYRHSGKVRKSEPSQELQPDSQQLRCVGRSRWNSSLLAEEPGSGCQPSLIGSSKHHSDLIISHLDVSGGQTVWGESAAEGVVGGHLQDVSRKFDGWYTSSSSPF